MRINKYIAGAGVCSRRKADELVKSGEVYVNGCVMTEPGYDVQEGDEVKVSGEVIEEQKKKLYYLLNKPLGFVTSVTDDKGRKTVIDLFDDAEARLFPVGRLDYNTGGVLFVTNDGDFAYRLTHPRHEVDKVYRVRVAGNVSKEALAKLRHGVEIDGRMTKRARVDVISFSKKSTILDITIHEGRNRQIRKMFQAVGKNVEELTRISEAGIGLGHLKPGEYRKLNPGEVGRLMGV